MKTTPAASARQTDRRPTVRRRPVAAATLALVAACFAAQASAADDADVVPGRLLVALRPGAPAAAGDGLLAAHGAQRIQRLGGSRLRIVDTAPGDEQALLAVLARLPEVRFVERDRRVRHDASNDPFLSSQWHLARVQATEAWTTTQGEGVILAVPDSGIDTAHPEFSGRLLPGYNFVNGNTNVSDVRNHDRSMRRIALPRVWP
jgi:subtilisin family serine protease